MPKGKYLLPKSFAQRIEERSITQWSDDSCWLSDRSADQLGYVHLKRMVDGESTNRQQHVIAWEMHNAEPVPEGMVVMHTCDNPGCFNPNHLRIGTQSENIRDSVTKGRHSSLTKQAAPLSFGIRYLRNLGFRQTAIAEILGCHQATVCMHLKSSN